jgi:DNA-binding SARP family transcriptional activator
VVAWSICPGQSAGRPADAIALYERTVDDSERMLGLAHPVTLDARASLAEMYQTAGRPADAIAAYELLLADAERQLGAGHPATLSARQPGRRLRGQRAGQGGDRAVRARAGRQ